MKNVKNEDSFNISDIYDISWYRVGIKIFEYEQLVSENNQLNDNRYMLFNNSGVLFCNSTTDECKQYNYSYDDSDLKYKGCPFIKIEKEVKALIKVLEEE